MASFSERTKLETAAAANSSYTVATLRSNYVAYLGERPAKPVTYEQFAQVVDYYARSIA